MHCSMIKVEMHSHTRYSPDGFINEQQLARQAKRKGIDCICVTDHNTIQGALEFSKKLPLKIVVGEEIRTVDGEITGLFLRKEIPPGLSLTETISKIKGQDGIVYVPHPFDEFRDSAVRINEVEKIKNLIDVIEVFNSRTLNPNYNRMVLEFAQKNNITVAVGSDAHHMYELGQCYMEMADFHDKESFLESLRGATYVIKKCPFALRLYLKGLKFLTGKS